MDEFNYLAVLISIILGLGITQLLSGIGRWVENRSSFHVYAPAIVWVAILLVVHIQTWWTMFGMRHHLHWTFLQFAVVLLQPITLFLLTTAVLPGPTATVLDLKANYFTQRRWFFGLLVALLAVSLSKDLVLNGTLPDNANLLFHVLLFLTSLIAMITASELYHRFIAYFSAALIAVYIALLFAKLE